MKSIALLASVATLALSAPALAATYAPLGPVNDVSIATVTGGGWTQIYRGAYGSSASLASMFTGAQTYVMIGGVNNDSGQIDVLAWASLADVMTYTAQNVTHLVNGTEWYFNGGSMGFAGAGDTISQNSADTNGSCWLGGAGCVAERDRLSWHTGGPSGYGGVADTVYGGWRSGDHIWLNSSSDFDRIIFTANSIGGTVPEPATWALMITGFGMVGTTLRRRKTVAVTA